MQLLHLMRGATSLNGGQALLLVDGVKTSDLSLLNPQDIESVSVLKMLPLLLFMVPVPLLALY